MNRHQLHKLRLRREHSGMTSHPGHNSTRSGHHSRGGITQLGQNIQQQQERLRAEMRGLKATIAVFSSIAMKALSMVRRRGVR